MARCPSSACLALRAFSSSIISPECWSFAAKRPSHGTWRACAHACLTSEFRRLSFSAASHYTTDSEMVPVCLVCAHACLTSEFRKLSFSAASHHTTDSKRCLSVLYVCTPASRVSLRGVRPSCILLKQPPVPCVRLKVLDPAASCHTIYIEQCLSLLHACKSQVCLTSVLVTPGSDRVFLLQYTQKTYLIRTSDPIIRSTIDLINCLWHLARTCLAGNHEWLQY